MTTPAPRKRRSRSRGGASKAGSKSAAKAATRPTQHTSQSTTRAAYGETRRWLLAEHGPVCAYCARKFAAKDMTLDHVSPRRGQDAYDRRDNLVLACKACNAAKADKPILAFLLQRRERAVSLAQYGVHLSPMLRDMALQIADGIVSRDAPPADDDSPYADVGYREPLRPYRVLGHEDGPPGVIDDTPAASGDADGAEPPRRSRRRGRRR